MGEFLVQANGPSIATGVVNVFSVDFFPIGPRLLSTEERERCLNIVS